MKIFGYGEDSLTLYALKCRMSQILREFNDRTSTSDCIRFYRPSFGRSGGKGSAEFGEFDAIVASRENVYLIESKWHLYTHGTIRPEQEWRHKIFKWYFKNWKREYLGNWELFVKKHKDIFKEEFPHKKIAPCEDRHPSLLANNLEFVLSKLQEHCRNFSGEQNIKDVLVLFYKGCKPPVKNEETKSFVRIFIDYNRIIEGDFIVLE